MIDEIVASVVESLTNSLELSAAYGQIWVIRPYTDHNGNRTLGVFDERSDELKYAFSNPDPKMAVVIDEVTENGWIATKQKYLTNHDFKVSIIEN